ncbi:MAG: OmpA family protein [Gammaproteobacteria bacterium]|nr:OmpA family protein [Gammaproteobacteria bacterium]
MIKNIIGIAAAATLTTGCGMMTKGGTPVSGQVEGNSSYLVDGAGNVVIATGRGECVKNGSYNKENMLLGCDPDAAAKAQAEADAAAKAAAEKAAAEKAAAEKAAADKAAADKAAAAAAAAAAAQPVVMNLSGKALFATGSSTLSGNGETAMQKLAGQLGEYKEIKSLKIIGHTDSQGSDAVNQALSVQRAESVRDYLVQSGVAGSAQIDVIGMGSSQPVASNDTAQGRQENRRVEIEVVGTK